MYGDIHFQFCHQNIYIINGNFVTAIFIHKHTPDHVNFCTEARVDIIHHPKKVHDVPYNVCVILRKCLYFYYLLL